MGGQVKGKNRLPPPAAARRVGEEEEEQMEEFFGLLKSIREMKDRCRPVGGGGCSPLKKARSTAWTPAFEWEDFADDDAAASKKRLQAAGAISWEDGGERKEGKVEGSRNTLDLNYLPL